MLLRVLRRSAIAATLLVLLLIGVLRAAGPPATTAIPPLPRGGLEVGDRARGTFRVGGYTVVVNAGGITVTHPRSPTAVWAGPRDASFLVAAVAEATVHTADRLVRISDRWDEAFAEQTLEGADVDREGRLVLTGRLRDPEELDREIDYQMFLAADAAAGGLRIDVQVLEEEVNRLTLVTEADRTETVHGLGQQFTAFDLRGRTYPIVPRRQGLGRGQQPLSLLVDMLGGRAGSADTTPAPLARYVTSAPRSLRLDTDQVSVVDLRSPTRIAATVWDDALHAVAATGAEPRDHVAAHARAAGLMRRLPRWAGEGAIVGLHGGTQRVREDLRVLQAAGVEVAAVWIPDWSGVPDEGRAGLPARIVGVDGDRYAGWDELVADLAEAEIRVLTTQGPVLARQDPRFALAAEAGWLVASPDGGPYLVELDGQQIGIVDLLDARARAWFVDVIVEEVLGAGVSGFEADLGEILPPDAVTAAGSGLALSAAFATAWADATADALARADLGEDGLVWHSAAGPGTAAAAPAMSTGDQLADFGGTDGLASALDAMLSAGISGLGVDHVPVGGRTTYALPGFLPDVAPSVELRQRGAELSAFTGLLRTDVADRPGLGVDTTDAEVAAHLAAMTDVFRALAPERARLGLDLARQGLPYVRHPVLVVPEEPDVADQEGVFFLGEDIMVAPVLEPGVDEVEVTLPTGSWVDIWTGEVTEVSRADVAPRNVAAPIGRPAAWARRGTGVDIDLALWRGRTG